MWKTLSQPSETLSLDQFHTQQYDPHRVLQSITGKWIGLDGKYLGSLAVIFSAEGLPIYVAFYEESKFINGHYQAVEPRPDSTTAIPELGILISVIQGFLYLAVSLPSRTASFRPEANSAEEEKERQSVLMSVLQRGGIFRHPRRSPQRDLNLRQQ